jgi:hypothetical protein
MVAQLRDVLPAGQSTQVPQKHEQLRLSRSKHLAQTYTIAIQAFERKPRSTLADLQIGHVASSSMRMG